MRKFFTTLMLAAGILTASAQTATKNVDGMKSFEPAPWVLPQPVLIIGTYNADGTANAMNAAWGGQCGGREIIISLGSHATTANMERNKEFTVTFATTSQVVAADYVGVVSGNDVKDKVANTGWKVAMSPNINAPVFKDFPVTLECKVKEVLNGSLNSGCLLIGEIVGVQAREDYLAEDGLPDVEKMKLITYDGIHHNYIELGGKVGEAFSDGDKLKK